MYDGMMNPMMVGQAVTQGIMGGYQMAQQAKLNEAMAAYAQNPSMEGAMGVARHDPRMGLQLRGMEEQRQRAEQEAMAKAEEQRLTAAAVQGDAEAAAQLAGINPQLWMRLDDRAKAAVEQRTDFMGEAALAISQLPEAERAQAWDAYAQQGVQLGYSDLAQYVGKYSPDALNGLLAQTGKVKQFLDLTRPRWLSVQPGGTVVNTNDPQAVQQVNEAAQQAAFGQQLPPGWTIDGEGGAGASPQSFRGIEGERVTSTFRSPKHNRRVGGVDNSYHTKRFANGTAMARDSVPPPGMSMAEYARRLQALNPHMQVINEGDHVHMEPR